MAYINLATVSKNWYFHWWRARPETFGKDNFNLNTALFVHDLFILFNEHFCYFYFFKVLRSLTEILSSFVESLSIHHLNPSLPPPPQTKTTTTTKKEKKKQKIEENATHPQLLSSCTRHWLQHQQDRTRAAQIPAIQGTSPWQQEPKEEIKKK